jgi:hypothetical protein
MINRRLCAALSLVLAVSSAYGADYAIEVRNGPHVRRDAVVTHTVTREWVRLFQDHTVAETTGGQVSPVPCALDTSGEAPVVVILLGGQTAPDAVRTFAVVPRREEAAPVSDLVISETATDVRVENGYYRLCMPRHGGGGFPRDIRFVKSGYADPRLHFLDRIVRPKSAGGGLAQYCARDCEDAEARVVFKSPLRVAIESRTGFGTRAAESPGQPVAVYRYVYTAFSPVVDVSVRYTREDDGPWREVHVLHLTRGDRYYSAFETGDPPQTHAMQPKGARSRAVTAPQWAVMTDGTNACGVGCDGAVCWDASDEFVYYVRRACARWEGRACGFEGALYFGPSGDAAWYTSWLGLRREPEISFFRDGQAWLPVEREPLEGAHELKNDVLRVVFGAATNGFDCLGIENLLGDGARFVRARDGAAGLWSLTFQTPADAEGRRDTVTLDNRCDGAKTRDARRVRRGVDFVWEGIDLPGEPGAVDVRAEVRIGPGAGASAWRLAVTNRSRRFGLWQSEYPLLRAVTPPRVGDALLPRGNWGGSLVRRHAGSYAGRYPSHACPVQMLAFQLGEAGLYLAAHDGGARVKELSVTREQDVTFRVPAADAGVPGAAGGPDFPVVVAAYAGDWWQAARVYRAWATRQAWTSKGPIGARPDYPARMRDLGLWMLLGGSPDAVTNGMAWAARLVSDMPIGVHWYSWHQIPFDNSYPEYFPTKPGLADAARAMAAQGQTVMPYINARLWDRDIPSFAGAYAATCKQPSGTNYVETYGSGRSLVPMCPYTKLWQGKIQEICGRLLEECGVNGIYLDQVGSAAPVLCHDASHGHPVGGGRHWVEGYHTMLRQVKADAVRRGALLTTEDSAEPYMDVIDGCLAWNERRQEDVPLLPAVYSGYTIYFTSPEAAHDTVDAFCAAQARDFLWGCQLGWNDPWILQEGNREKLRFQEKLCRLRLATKAFMVCGQLLGEVKASGGVPVAAHVWNRRQPHEVRLPVVQTAVWSDGKGQLAVFVVNTSGEPQRVALDFDPAQWLTGSRAPWRVSRLVPEGVTPAAPVDGNRIQIESLPPRSAHALVYAQTDSRPWWRKWVSLDFGVASAARNP